MRRSRPICALALGAALAHLPQAARAERADREKPVNIESLHVYMHRLRTKLVPYKLQIDTLVNVGYRLLLPAPQDNGSE